MRFTGMNFKSSSSRRGQQLLHKKQYKRVNEQSSKEVEYRCPNNKLRQQKSQLYPNLVSIIEEEETFSDDDEDSDLRINDDEEDNVDDEESHDGVERVQERKQMDQIEEENSYDLEDDNQDKSENISVSNSSNYRQKQKKKKYENEEFKTDDEQRKSSDNNKQRNLEFVKISQANTAKKGHEYSKQVIMSQKQRTDQQQNNVNPQSEKQNIETSNIKQSTSSMMPFKSSLSKIFDEYQRKQDINQQLTLLNNIFQNYNIITKQKQPIISHITIKNNSISEDPYYGTYQMSPSTAKFRDISAANTARNKNSVKKHQLTKALESGDSFQVSKDQKTSSHNSNTSPSKNSSNQNPNTNIVPKIESNPNQKQVKFAQPHSSSKEQVQIYPTTNLSDIKQQQRQTLNVQTTINNNLLNPSALQGNGIQGIQLSLILPLKKKQTQGFQLELKKLPQSESETESINVLQSNAFRSQQSDQFDQTYFHNLLPQVDLMQIIEKSSNSPSLSINKKASILSFYDQINQILMLNNHQIQLKMRYRNILNIPSLSDSKVQWEQDDKCSQLKHNKFPKQQRPSKHLTKRFKPFRKNKNVLISRKTEQVPNNKVKSQIDQLKSQQIKIFSNMISLKFFHTTLFMSKLQKTETRSE
ncbi:hypothetical protein OXYTRIMIC_164 [Oxytricha trifallax]|uniref:Uncharacterized protein n=1 Tax=Oxytricha trifallax TaxID=1172189 RepID=A0A073IBR8_9SPIT|nr:hypothetical protein OXYTRIMIC_164 [Oxytricha trifallax]